MQIATVQVVAPVYVRAGQYLDGVVLDAPQWARPGRHAMEAGFAQLQDAAGMLEVESVDGVPVVWGACCSGGSHDHE